MIAFCLACTTWAYAQPINLIENSGFEDGLNDWSVGFGEAPQLDREVFHSGAASARVSVHGAVSALDSAELLVGRDIDPRETYRVSAWIKSGGIEKGDCGGRLYCYDSRGKVVVMHVFGGLTDGAPAGDWQQASLEVDPDGPTPIPIGTDRLAVRFSIWAQDQECTGTVWVDDVSVTPVSEEVTPPPGWLKHSEAGTVLIWQDDAPSVGVASDPKALADILTKHGMAANLVDAGNLAEPGALSPRWVDLVILPYGEAFPADAREAFLSYVRHGGSFLTLGGLAFGKQLRQVDGEWMQVGQVVPDDRKRATVADFDGDATVAWDANHSAEDDGVSVEELAPGAAQSKRAARLSLEEIRAFAYGALKDGAAAPDAEHSILSFWARGDENTRQLAIEPREEDGSRWKKVVPLTTDWERYDIPGEQFLSYATDDRGGPGDHLHPERVSGLWFGFTRQMVGAGPHVLWLDQVAWAPVLREAGPPPAPIRPPVGVDLTLAAFGSHIDASPADPDTLPVFVPPRHIENAVELRAAEGQSVLDIEPIRGRFSGYLALAPTHRARTDAGEAVRTGGPRTGRLVPLLEARDQDGSGLGPVGALFLPSSKLAANAVWAFLGIDNADMVEALGDAFGEALCRIADMAAGAPTLGEPELRFVTDGGGGPYAELQVRVRGRPPADRPLRLAVGASADGGGGEAKDVVVRELLRPPETARVRMPFDLFGRSDSRVELELQADGAEVDREGIVVDPRASFLELVDWLLANQGEDGTYSGVSFQDQRAARGLLGAYEIAGDERYKESAIRWGEEMIRLQREDGGYRMGYGITDRGESCYVADGGEIAIGMARLVSYTEGEQRQRFIDSVRAYMGYRESFREPNGAIGVGWCLHDYGQRPIVPLDTPTRIYAGELNRYTIGCTLAAAAAYATITGDPADKATALRDTDWLLEHYESLSGAAAESAMWAHRYLADEELKQRIEEHMRRSFRERIISPADRSWLAGGGRSVLDLDIIAYWLANIDPQDGDMQAARARWLYALCGSNSTSAAHELLARESLNSAERRFLCFLAVALADAVQPMVSLGDF